MRRASVFAQRKPWRKGEFTSPAQMRSKGSPAAVPLGSDATGFINLWGLPDTVQALREQGKLK